ncbi:hypothetical protein CNEO4_650016 [Clostridium neonatale]|uniref:Uncharacterized protein n=1 Tax=Clostridium neonatale TaxID=137838 RepID=A0AA86MQ91_9CLOT|nr:hypothetical protein CNEO_10316 [Clostridium neonatale]CAI3636034.1 hypothetical protein CNEO2_300049 [Clostridium neonatale]CAI3659585.1 hypothetical protein CNEO4_480011 [Clostridium neonatale]CAI3669284.1 hypothetical protein CNEO4_480015 [Clostridium neonatale]CAI3683551.1 hypothetical protein CNEO4_500015 [Clostridium neonatale]
MSEVYVSFNDILFIMSEVYVDFNDILFRSFNIVTLLTM